MISIAWNPGSAPALLAVLSDERLAARAAKVGAETYETEIHDWIAMGRSFDRGTGQLEQSIGWRPEGPGALVYAQAEHALYIEQGTGLHGPRGQAYEIAPKPGGGRKALRIPIPGGGHRFAKSVIHPGIEARPFFFADFEARQSRMVEAILADIADRMRAAR